jgi:aminopeptidase N
VEISTASGKKSYWIKITKAEETFPFPTDSAPLMVLFDKGNKVLKSAEFEKSVTELIYQLEHADAVTDRADAAVALGGFATEDSAVGALGRAAAHDAFWGIRVQAAQSLGRINSPAAKKLILTALDDKAPWVRQPVVRILARFPNDPEITARLEALYKNDSAFGVRGAALAVLAQAKTPGAYDMLAAAVSGDSPNDSLRRAALFGFGALGDERAVPLLMEWSSLGKPLDTRPAAIQSLGRLGVKDEAVETRLIGYLGETYDNVRRSAIGALGQRGDPAAIPALEAMLKSNELALGSSPQLVATIARLKNGGTGGGRGGRGGAGASATGTPAAATVGTPPPSADMGQILEKLNQLEQHVAELNARLKKIEDKVGAPKQ